MGKAFYKREEAEEARSEEEEGTTAQQRGTTRHIQTSLPPQRELITS